MMRVRERVPHRDEQADDVVERGDARRTVRGCRQVQLLAERSTLDAPGGEKDAPPFVDVEFIDGQDVRVLQRSGDARLVDEMADALGIGVPRLRIEHLRGDRAIQVAVEDGIDATGRTRTQEVLDRESPALGADPRETETHQAVSERLSRKLRWKAGKWIG